MKKVNISARLLTALLVAVMLLSILPAGVFAAETETVTVSFTAQAEGAFLCAPQQNITVAADLAESYGYTDDVDGVSALDVLVKAHEVVFGEDFTAETCTDYLTVSYGYVGVCFGSSNYMGFAVNGDYPYDPASEYGDWGYTGYVVTTAPISTGDTVDFFYYEDSYWMDFYTYFKQDGAQVSSISAQVDSSVTLNLEGFMYMSGSYVGDDRVNNAALGAITDAQICWVDLSTGALTEIEDAITDDDGNVTITMPSQAGTYALSAIGESSYYTVCTLPLLIVEVNWTWEGDGTEESPYLLQTAEDFDLLDAAVTAGESFSGEYFLVTADVTLSEGWDGIGYGKVDTKVSWGYTVPYTAEFIPFSGVLDGAGHTLTFPAGSQPLFDCVSGATIKNLKIYSAYIADDGLIANYTIDSAYPEYTAKIENVTILSGTKIAGSGFLGGYASGTNVVTIDGCTIESGVIIGCDENGDPNGSSNIGGFGGDFNGTVSNSTCAATIYGVNFVGGILGGQGQSMTDTSVVSCSFTGTIVATGNYVGGIAGCGYTGTGWGFSSNASCISVENCYVTGSVTGGNYVGGILGAEPAVTQCWANGIGYIRNNVFYGTVAATETDAYVGGVIGYMKSLDKYNIIENNYYLDTAAQAGIGGVGSVDTTTEKYGRDDDPLGADADKLTCAKTQEEMTDGTVTALLNSSESSKKNWVQSKDGPVFDGEAVVPDSLTISGSAKTNYVEGDALDLSGMIVTLVWSDGSTTEVALEDVTVSGYDSAVLGEQTITLTYGSLSTTFVVTVSEDQEKVNAAAAQTVIDAIDAIGTVTLDSKDAIDAARAAYDALTDDQKALVTNLDVLTAAETAYAALVADAAAQAAAQAVIDAIDAIGTVTSDSKEAIDMARAAYDALTDAQKALVTNLDVLTAAEAAYDLIPTTGDTAPLAALALALVASMAGLAVVVGSKKKFL